MWKILAIDYGSRRCGLAITDVMQIIASPLDTVDTDRLIFWLTALLVREPVGEIVVGEARYADGSASSTTHEQEKFVQQLKKKFPHIPIVRQDERYSSQMAMEEMYKSGMKKSQRKIKGNIDKISAALILRSYLEQKNSRSSGI